MWILVPLIQVMHSIKIKLILCAHKNYVYHSGCLWKTDEINKENNVSDAGLTHAMPKYYGSWFLFEKMSQVIHYRIRMFRIRERNNHEKIQYCREVHRFREKYPPISSPKQLNRFETFFKVIWVNRWKRRISRRLNYLLFLRNENFSCFLPLWNIRYPHRWNEQKFTRLKIRQIIRSSMIQLRKHNNIFFSHSAPKLFVMHYSYGNSCLIRLVFA